MYTTDTDISPFETMSLMRKLVNDNGTPALDDYRKAIDAISANAVAREFVAKLILSKERTSQTLRELADDIS